MRALARVPRHPDALLVRQRTRRDLRRRPSGRPRPTPTRMYDQISSTVREPARSGRGPCWSGSASRCWPPPTTRRTIWPPTRRWPTRRTFGARVIPTFRPDRYLEPARPAGWPSRRAARRSGGHRRRRLRRVHRGAGGPPSLLRLPRRHVRRPQPPRRLAEPLDAAEAQRIYAPCAGRERPVAEEATAFRRHMVLEMARMSCDDGLVMTLHPGCDATTTRRRSPGSAPTPATTFRSPWSSPDALQPLLERYGTHPNLHLVLFTVDADVFSREIAPLAGFYPAVYIGAPWWFLDNPSAIRSLPARVTEIAGLTRLSGFIDDTRAFCSIPARHDMSRRLDAGFLAGLVAQHRLDEDEALDTIDRPGRRSTAKGVQAMSASTAADRRLSAAAVPCRRRRRPAAPVRIVHLGLGQLLPRAPGLVHRPGTGRRRVGDRRVHRTVGRAGDGARPRRTACTR